MAIAIKSLSLISEACLVFALEELKMLSAFLYIFGSFSSLKLSSDLYGGCEMGSFHDMRYVNKLLARLQAYYMYPPKLSYVCIYESHVVRLGAI